MANNARFVLASSLLLATLGLSAASGCSQQDTASSTKKAAKDDGSSGSGTSGTGSGTGSGPSASGSPANGAGTGTGTGSGGSSTGGVSNEEIVVNPNGTGSMPATSDVATGSASGSATGSASGDAPATGLTGLSALTDQLYVDVLDHAAGESDTSYWDPKLGGAGADIVKRRDVLLSLVLAPEAIKTTHARWFREWLGRTQDVATLKMGTGLDPFVTNLSKGSTFSDTAAFILGTEEYYIHTGSTVDGWLAGVYAIALGRGVDTAGRNLFAPRVAMSSRQVVAKELLNSDEALTHLVTTWYKTYYKREGDMAGIAEWKAKLAAGAKYNDPAVLALFLSTPEYYKRSGN